MRKTKIIATLGPKSETKEMIQALFNEGVDIFRLNLSHGDIDWHKEVVNRISEVAPNAEILIDTRGPEIRLGDFDGMIEIKEGDEIIFGEGYVPISYDLTKSIKKGDKIAIDSGMLFVEVVEIDGKIVKTKSLDNWHISARRHVNLPGERVDMNTIPEKDREDLRKFQGDKRIDHVALSFARTQEDIIEAQNLMPHAKIIAKIENCEGVENFLSILDQSFGIMIARGDLGIETELEELPVLQRRMLRKIRHLDKFAVVATEMLESMVKNPRPTRAEVSDIATAVFEKADAVMLSQETAMGNYPIRAVSIMRKIIEYTEEEMCFLR
ncbi:MAG: pyruvate kinase [Candidatus Gracilibacteria bacterium]|jgi:pyruvate kinase|nr:pyruvate kinase [Candidatus Gracilibacteria bacterium]